MPALPVLHLPFCFHTLATDEYSHCAFTGKCRRIPKMLAPLGWKTVCYANEGSDIPFAHEVVTMLNKKEFEEFYPRPDKTAFHGNHAVIGMYGWPTFNSRLIVELSKRVKPGDFILHPFGRAHEALVATFPQCHHVESGIGYSDKPFGCWRIYESQAWRHYHLGRWDHDQTVPRDEKGLNRYYSWVVPNYFDLDDWEIGNGSEDYVVYMGRITPEKGMAVIAAMIRAFAERPGKPPKFIFAGQGNFEQEVMKHVLGAPAPNESRLDIEYRGPVHGGARSELIKNARCMLMPTNFIEPFAGAGVEAMLCGTPLLGVDYGAFTETIIEGVTGFRCNTLGDWVQAIESSKHLNRQILAQITRNRYSLETCAQLYNKAFLQIADLRGAGWYTMESHRIPKLHTDHFYTDIQGWFDDGPLHREAIKSSGNPGHFVEIGCWKGRSTAFTAVEILNSGKDIVLDVVDTFEGSPEHGTVDKQALKAEFERNIKPVNKVIGAVHAMSSVEASFKYDDKSLDFVFIDGNHSYDYVMADIKAWFPKLKWGGIIGGDDYEAAWPGVMKAVNEVFGPDSIRVYGKNHWAVVKE